MRISEGEAKPRAEAKAMKDEAPAPRPHPFFESWQRMGGWIDIVTLNRSVVAVVCRFFLRRAIAFVFRTLF